jgi:hypothetical protein
MQRFVVNSMLEVYHNSTVGDTQAAPFAAEFGPSRNPSLPSVYRVDLDPVDVPFLTGVGGQTEGAQRGFEALAELSPNDNHINGTLGLTDSSIGHYPAPDASQAAVKIYQSGGASGSSDFDNPDVFLTRGQASRQSLLLRQFVNFRDGGATNVSVSRSPAGVVVDTRSVPAGDIGLAAVDFLEGTAADRTNLAGRVRVEPARTYRVSFRVSTPGRSDEAPQIRFRARCAKFQWTQKLELGGSRAVNSTEGRTLAAQALPGVGSQNPESDAGGQWYHLLMHSPLDLGIRPDGSGGVEARFPNLMAQPGTGNPAPSQRDLKVGFDVLDTLSFATGQEGEAANNLQLNRIEIRSYPVVAD